MPQIDDKMRIIQELVPGKQITLAHIVAAPDPILYQKLQMISGAQQNYSCLQ